MMQARFDKFGRRLPDTGHGCGCLLCARLNAPRYERRRDFRTAGPWGPLRRWLAQVVRSLSTGRPQAA
jgi:hypothetical protein